MNVISIRLNEQESKRYLSLRPARMSVKEFFNTCLVAYKLVSSLEKVLGVKQVLELKTVLTGDVETLKRFAERYEPYNITPLSLNVFNRVILEKVKGEDLNYIYRVMSEKGVVLC